MNALINTFYMNLMLERLSYWHAGYITYFMNKSMVSCQKGPTCHAYAWQIESFWQDTLEILNDHPG